MRILPRITLAAALVVTPAVTPFDVQAQDGWWDWTLRELSIHLELGTPSSHRHVPDVVWGAGHGGGAPYRYDGDDRYDQGGYGPEYRGRYAPPAYAPPPRARAKKGPPFCRTGAGHPVHGWRWCVDKGFAAPTPVYRPLRWERRYWEDVLPRYRPRRWPASLGHRELREILGPSVYARLDREGARLGGRFALSGRWIRPSGSLLVLQVRSGMVPVAELTDLGADGWIDVVMVAGP